MDEDDHGEGVSGIADAGNELASPKSLGKSIIWRGFCFLDVRRNLVCLYRNLQRHYCHYREVDEPDEEGCPKVQEEV